MTTCRNTSDGNDVDDTVVLDRHIDHRGMLSVLDIAGTLPFKPDRLFLITDVPAGCTRGDHAHRVEEQFVLCARGSCDAVVDRGLACREFGIDAGSGGIYVPPMAWLTLRNFAPGTVIAVLASGPFDPGDYIDDYDTFINEVRHAADRRDAGT